MPDKFSFASIRPEQTLDLLTQREMASLAMADQATPRLFRQCALAVLNTGSDIDDPAKLYADYSDFEIEVIPQPRGLKLELRNAPASAASCSTAS